MKPIATSCLNSAAVFSYYSSSHTWPNEKGTLQNQHMCRLQTSHQNSFSISTLIPLQLGLMQYFSSVPVPMAQSIEFLISKSQYFYDTRCMISLCEMKDFSLASRSHFKHFISCFLSYIWTCRYSVMHDAWTMCLQFDNLYWLSFSGCSWQTGHSSSASFLNLASSFRRAWFIRS